MDIILGGENTKDLPLEVGMCLLDLNNYERAKALIKGWVWRKLRDRRKEWSEWDVEMIS